MSSLWWTIGKTFRSIWRVFWLFQLSNKRMQLQKKNSVKYQIQPPWCVANFFEIVKGVGMFPNKVLQKVSKAEILQNAILLFYEYCPLCLHFLYQ